MHLRDVPHVEAALKDVWPVYPIVWEGFDTAITQRGTSTRTYPQDDRGELGAGTKARPSDIETYDPYLLPHLVRYAQKLYLAERGLSTEIEMDDLAFSGLRLRYGKRVIRLRKAGPDDSIPPTGDSEPWRAVCQLILSEEFAWTSPDLYMSGMPHDLACSQVCRLSALFLARLRRRRFWAESLFRTRQRRACSQSAPVMEESDL